MMAVVFILLHHILYIRDGELLASGISMTGYVDSGLGATETHCYIVAKVDMGEIIAESNEACATTDDTVGQEINLDPWSDIDWYQITVSSGEQYNGDWDRYLRDQPWKMQDSLYYGQEYGMNEGSSLFEVTIDITQYSEKAINDDGFEIKEWLKINLMPILLSSTLLFFGIGLFVIICGYIIMEMGGTESFQSVKLAPLILIVGYCVLIPMAILIKPTNKA